MDCAPTMRKCVTRALMLLPQGPWKARHFQLQQTFAYVCFLLLGLRLEASDLLTAKLTQPIQGRRISNIARVPTNNSRFAISPFYRLSEDSENLISLQSIFDLKKATTESNKHARGIFLPHSKNDICNVYVDRGKLNVERHGANGTSRSFNSLDAYVSIPTRLTTIGRPLIFNISPENTSEIVVIDPSQAKNIAVLRDSYLTKKFFILQFVRHVE